MIQLPLDASSYINTKNLLTAIYILQSPILAQFFSFKYFFLSPEDCSKDQHSFWTTQHIREEMLLVEAPRNDLAAGASLCSLQKQCCHDSVMFQGLAATKSSFVDAVCDVPLTWWLNWPLCSAVCLILSRWHSSCFSASAGPFYTQIMVLAGILITCHRNKGQQTGMVSAAQAQRGAHSAPWTGWKHRSTGGISAVKPKGTRKTTLQVCSHQLVLLILIS